MSQPQAVNQKLLYQLNTQNPPKSHDRQVLTEAKSSSVTDSEGMEIDQVFKKLTAALQKDSPEDLKKLLEELTLVNMMDVGGQLAFLDVLPTLTVGPALYLLFFRLDQELNKTLSCTILLS